MNVLLEKKSLQIQETKVFRYDDLLRGQGQSFAAFGEILQGVLPSDRSFLVTLPIQMFSSAYFEYGENINLSVYPLHKFKSFILARKILEYYKKPEGGKLVLQSEIPEAKGMASSSADLVATARAVTDAFNFQLDNAILGSFMAQIEPSDGVMYNGCVSYYHQEASLRNYLGWLPPMVILAIDEGGEVDTIKFNSRIKNFTNAEKYEYSLLLKNLEAAITEKDIMTIGKVATRSAILNQKLKKNKYLDIFIRISEELQNIGIAIAHSGTYIGLLFDRSDPLLDAKITNAKKLFCLNGISEPPIIYNSFPL